MTDREVAVTVSGRPRPLADADVERAVRLVLTGEARDGTISVTFLGRDEMRRVNREWKGRDAPTDVLAFGLAGLAPAVLGDIYICPWVARREARARHLPFEQELLRLVVHGTLHVLGFDHPEGDERMTCPMWARQELYVARLG